MEKEKKELDVPAVVLSIFGIATAILVTSFVYFSLNGTNYTEVYRGESGEIKNITEFGFTENKEEIEIVDNANLSDSQKERVKYIAIVLKLYNLHEIPYTQITPKIQVEIDEDSYFVEIIKGDIVISRGETDKEDIAIKVNSEEIIKIKENESYAKESVSSGRTSIEKVADDFTLFSKGYLDLYRDLNL